jgi:hypothetical protein
MLNEALHKHATEDDGDTADDECALPAEVRPKYFWITLGEP